MTIYECTMSDNNIIKFSEHDGPKTGTSFTKKNYYNGCIYNNMWLSNYTHSVLKNAVRRS